MDLQKDITLSQYKNPFIVLVIIIAFVFIGKSIYSGYLEDKAKLENRHKQIQDKELVIKRYAEAQQDYEDLSKNFFRGDALLFRKYVQKVARETGVAILSLKSSREDRGFYWEENIKLRAKTPYKELVDFIAGIEKRFIEVESVVLNRENEVLRIDLEIKGVILKQ